MEQGVAEDGRARPEANFGPGAVLSPICLRGLRLAQAIGLLVDMTVAADGQQQLVGERVHDGDAHAVQTAGHLVGVVIEFAAGVQHGHDDFGGRTALFRVDVTECRGRCRARRRSRRNGW